MNLGVTSKRGAGIPPQMKTAEMLLAESNKKLRELNEDLCCKLNTLIDAINNINVTVTPSEGTLYNEAGSLQFSPKDEATDIDIFNYIIDGQEKCIHSISFSIIEGDVVDGVASPVDLNINGNVISYPVGYSASFEATSCLDMAITLVAKDGSDSGKIIFDYILGPVV